MGSLKPVVRVVFLGQQAPTQKNDASCKLGSLWMAKDLQIDSEVDQRKIRADGVHIRPDRHTPQATADPNPRANSDEKTANLS